MISISIFLIFFCWIYVFVLVLNKLYKYLINNSDLNCLINILYDEKTYHIDYRMFPVCDFVVVIFSRKAKFYMDCLLLNFSCMYPYSILIWIIILNIWIILFHNHTHILQKILIYNYLRSDVLVSFFLWWGSPLVYR